MENKINTIKMVRKIREKHYELIQKKSKQDIVKFFKNKAKKTNEILKEVVGHDV
jgi:hypothetical protein